MPTLTHTKPQFARVCIELDLSKPLDHKIWIGTSSEDGFWQSVEYEKLPKLCSHCSLQGHEESFCRHAMGKKTKTANNTQVHQGVANWKQIEPFLYIPKASIQIS